MSPFRLLSLSSALLLLLLGTGCPPAAYGGLDSNRDGELAADDLDPGAAAAYFDLGADGNGVEASTGDDDAADDDDGGGDDTGTALELSEILLYPAYTEGDWYFQGVLAGENTNYNLSIRFENEEPLAVGSGDVVGGSFNAEDNSIYAYGGNEPGGRMAITDITDELASGGLTSATRFEVIEGDMGSGRFVVIEGFAFNGVEISEPPPSR